MSFKTKEDRVQKTFLKEKHVFKLPQPGTCSAKGILESTGGHNGVKFQYQR